MVCWSGRDESLVRIDTGEGRRGESHVSEHIEGFQGVDYKDSINDLNVAA